MISALVHHWPEFVIEGVLLGIFMTAACLAVVVMEYPGSPVYRRLHSSAVRRSIVGVLMGMTAVALIYSPWGQRSGAHMNPAVTLSFLVLGKVKAWDAAFYALAQFTGGVIGVVIPAIVFRRFVGHASVNYAVTIPGSRGRRAAWIGEFAVSLGMMGMVLLTSNLDAAAPYTGMFAGLLLAVFIAVEAPFSGMSLNPARTLGSALVAREARGLWIYFTAPPLAMLAAAGLYTAAWGAAGVYCAKLNHRGQERCIFDCQIERLSRPSPSPAAVRGITQDATPDDRAAGSR